MAIKHVISRQWFEEGKVLVASGNLDLLERRATYQRIAKRTTTLNDEALMVASMTEDDDDDEFVTLVNKIEANGFIIDDTVSV